MHIYLLQFKLSICCRICFSHLTTKILLELKFQKYTKKLKSLSTRTKWCYKTIVESIIVSIFNFNHLMPIRWLYLPLITNTNNLHGFYYKIQFHCFKYFLVSSFYLFLELSTIFFRHLLPKFNDTVCIPEKHTITISALPPSLPSAGFLRFLWHTKCIQRPTDVVWICDTIFKLT